MIFLFGNLLGRQIRNLTSVDIINIEFSNSEEDNLIDNRIIFTILDNEIWEGSTPVFCMKDFTQLQLHSLPPDLYIMNSRLESYKNLYNSYSCPDESPCTTYLTQHELSYFDF